MNWIVMGYHFLSAVVNCAVEHSAQIGKTAIDFGTCVAGKLFQ